MPPWRDTAQGAGVIDRRAPHGRDESSRNLGGPSLQHSVTHTEPLANWFRGAHINDVTLVPGRALPRLFFRCYKAIPARRRELIELAHLLLLGTSAEILWFDNQETDVRSGSFCALATFMCCRAKRRKPMTVRTTRTTISFSQPFKLKDLDDTQPPGDYLLDTDEELLEGLSRLVYRRVATLLHLPSMSRPQGRTEVVSVSPAELDAALERDRSGRA